MKLLMVVCLSFFAIYGYAQCTFEEIFPFELGMPKFKVTTIIATLPNLKEDKESNRSQFSFGWEKLDYLEGDSVYRVYLDYDYIYHPCFKGKENKLHLRFADDRLYEIYISLTFARTDFNKCMQNYNELVSVLRNSLTDCEVVISRLGERYEQVGEGFCFYPEIDEGKWEEFKTHSYDISYHVNYERKWDNEKNEHYQTGNVEGYTVQISYVNLYGTKLTTQGF